MYKAFSCRVKIAWYIVLIAYHGFDFVFDWYNYHKLYEDKTVSGLSISTNTTVVKYFLSSCVTGSVFTFFMAVVYGYYIYYHCYCIRHANYRSVSYSSGKFSIWGDRRCDKKCDRRFVTLELCVSTLELLGKDDIQSGILFWLYTSQSIVTRPSWYFIAFSVCSVCAHCKLCICFMSKLCGCGAGEKSCCNDDCSCVKPFAHFVCVIGLIGSAVFLVLTVVSLVKYIIV